MEKMLLNFFMNLFQMSLSASYLIPAVLLVRFVLRKAPKRMRSFLWLLVGIRLIFPFSVESVFSLIPDIKAADAYRYEMELPAYNAMADMEMKQPVSQPIQNTYVPFTEISGTKPQTTGMIYAKIWLVGMACMLGYMFYSYLRLKEHVRMSVPTDIVFDSNGRDGTNHAVKFYLSDAIDSPFLFGILHPRIYIPCGMAHDALPYVICHELTHKKKKDYLVKPLGFLILSVHWFNPFVWAAYIMFCRDIELICDEHVVRELGTAHKKAYSQALLSSAVNHHRMAACPIAFGEVGVKERVKNVLNYKKPAFWLMAAAVLACMIIPVCFMTQKKTAVPVPADTAAPTDLVPADLQKKDTIVRMYSQADSMDLIAGEYEMFLPSSLEAHQENDEDAYIFTPRLSLDRDGKFSFGYDPSSSYLILGTYDFVSDSVNAVTYDGKYHYQFTRIGHDLLRFDADESSRLHKANTDAAATVENGSIFVKNSVPSQKQADVLKLPAAAKKIEQWAKAFCDRDAGTILKLASEEVKKQFAEQDLLVQGADSEGGAASFGWSSPWPWGDTYDENGASCNYHILSATEHTAEILYYAWVSDPHVTVWREQLTYEMGESGYVITSESLQYMDGICTAEEFHHAYPYGIAETMMDYFSFNGAGEALNENAKENRNSDVYKNLFAPDTAAISLLNILNNPNKAGTVVRKSVTEENICIVTFEFYEDGSTVTVYMIRPYGADGIWVPYCMLDSSDARAAALLEAETAEYKAETGNLVYDHKMKINMLSLTPKE